MSKLLQQTAFVLLAVLIGFVGGGAIGARFVAPGSGLAGGATVAVYGLGGSILATIGAVVLARRLPPAGFRLALLAALGLAILIAFWIGARITAAGA